jgi:hypothetical protein
MVTRINPEKYDPSQTQLRPLNLVKSSVSLISLMHKTLIEETGVSYGIRKDNRSLYLFHPDKKDTKKLLSNNVLSLIHGLMVMDGLNSLYVDGFGSMHLELASKLKP